LGDYKAREIRGHDTWDIRGHDTYPHLLFNLKSWNLVVRNLVVRRDR
jgi:hypothetical protein